MVFLHVRRKVKIWRFIYLSEDKGKVEDLKHRRGTRIFKRSMRFVKKGEVNNQGPQIFQKRAPTQDGASFTKK